MVDRPTFSESWYRVTTLKPRLRSTVQIHRQSYRGRMWYVVQDPSNNQFFRIDDAAYTFVGLLDGNRTVAQVWEICNEQLGDRAPTQGESIQLLGQLYTSNLLQGDLPADAQGMFERARKRVRQQVGGFLTNLLFIRVPIFDPDRFLDRWVSLVGWIFTPVGFLLWLAWFVFALSFLPGHSEELFSNAQNILDPSNLFLLYSAFAVIKAIHEFGHGFSCKYFGKRSHTGGEVHVLGIMMMIFTPVPYVDASSAWTLRSRWQRAIVGAAGMYVELAVAAACAIVWANTSTGTLHSLAYNAMFVASVSTVLFNANPLLRYDGYYILSDLLEIPNLAQRSNEYLQHLVKRYVYGVQQSRTNAQTLRERLWLVFYGVASGIYRVFVSVAILLFVSDKIFIIGAAMAIGALVGWVFMPLGKFVHYLGTSDELARVRPRALATTFGFLVFAAIVVGYVKVPDRGRAEGVVEPTRLAIVHMEADGFIETVMDSGLAVTPGGAPLLKAHNLALEVERDRLLAQKRLAQVKRNMARIDEVALAQSLDETISALNDQLARANEQLANLQPKAPFDGTWISPDGQRLRGGYLKRGEQVGLVASADDLLIRAIADQKLGPLIGEELDVGKRVEIRIKDEPDLKFGGTILKILPAGQEQLPSAALGYMAGGATEVKMDDKQGTHAAEPFFEVRIKPDAPGAGAGNDSVTLASGQRVVVRFTLKPKSIAEQVYRAARQVLQRYRK